MISEDEKLRKDFIREMYRVYWANIARSMEGVWKILAPITVVGTIIVGVHKDYLPPSLGLSLAFVVIFWALNMTIDLNSWHRRNLFFLAKVEREFLNEEDYGVLLPVKYRRPKKQWITFYFINLLVFVILLLLIIAYIIFWNQKDYKLFSLKSLSFWVLIIGIGLTIKNFCTQEKSAERRFAELFGYKLKQNSTK